MKFLITILGFEPSEIFYFKNFSLAFYFYQLLKPFKFFIKSPTTISHLIVAVKKLIFLINPPLHFKIIREAHFQQHQQYELHSAWMENLTQKQIRQAFSRLKN